MASYTGPGTILGGLPIIAEVFWGTDYWGEGYSDIIAIYWRKRDGTKGKKVSQAIFDRVWEHDPYFCSLVEQLQDECAAERAQANGEAYPPASELVSLIKG